MTKTWQENRDIHECLSGPISPKIRHELMQTEIDALRAEFDRIKKQEPVYLMQPDGRCFAPDGKRPLGPGHADATLIKLYLAAGAQPSSDELPTPAGVDELTAAIAAEEAKPPLSVERAALIAELRQLACGGSNFNRLINESADMLAADVSYKLAFDEWINKTEWVQETSKPRELGMHRADILKSRIEALEAADAPCDVTLNQRYADGYSAGLFDASKQSAYQLAVARAVLAARDSK